MTRSGIRATEACCWLAMAPAKAIGLYDEALRDWPSDEVRDRGLHRSRLALACALDRAKDEGAQALVIAKQTAASPRHANCAGSARYYAQRAEGVASGTVAPRTMPPSTVMSRAASQSGGRTR